MPTYQYECVQCAHRFEIFQPITKQPLEHCVEECCPMKPWGKGKVKRIISGGMGLLFKGSGFYITDYRSPSYLKAAKAEKEVSSKASSSTGSSSVNPTPKP
ncbi:FmdB family zinc ribbon protein [Methylacidiphilum caldifontis]|uniref:FmdB family transcriptional regulator n=1 Tax=Methylacidiphilum caldifontis TaxID=2795386 RepID=A0A4Y8P753_9BACT|nr:FmdB family zinc ribbon protein [Methylacidiphilum caldifontis]QSR88842.1 zinc ribbon domain-containing protein [Methylacidiphilum caldifontis]TFE65911.1 FmdB family transcriptional regulator [Methylacidiphilum caldifontis]